MRFFVIRVKIGRFIRKEIIYLNITSGDLKRQSFGALIMELEILPPRDYPHSNRHKDYDVITFLVGPTLCEVSAHKSVLVTHSDVFKVMLTGALAEKGAIVLPDTRETVFRAFIRYLYTEEIDITEDNIVDILYVGKKYFVDKLVDKCQVFINSMVANENAVSILQIAEAFCLGNIRQHCVKHICTNFHKIARSADFLRLDIKNVVRIVHHLDLRVPTYIAYSLWEWCLAECSRRDVTLTSLLNQLVSEVKFMPISERLFIECFRHPCYDLTSMKCLHL
ncbi:BTB/POZ domain-containing protein 6-A-like [Argopecten irradians]|uniref:BTB/POZ domain-containing protein 6-A-like n=1 Tax=Argopecten irradians TaxID=31199 RepID=UPI003719016A